jgi:hypothetical protein
LTESHGGRIHLPPTLSDRPLARSPIDRHGRPAVTVFARKVQQQGVPVVLDANAMIRIPFFLQTADDPSTGSAAHE